MIIIILIIIMIIIIILIIISIVIFVPGSVPVQTTPNLQFVACRFRAGGDNFSLTKTIKKQ